jgi:hypothetical protein
MIKIRKLFLRPAACLASLIKGLISHHQPIDLPTAGAQAFLMDYLQGERAHNPPRGPSADWWVLTTANAASTNGLTCLPKHGRARDDKVLVIHPMIDH